MSSLLSFKCHSIFNEFSIYSLFKTLKLQDQDFNWAIFQRVLMEIYIREIRVKSTYRQSIVTYR